MRYATEVCELYPAGGYEWADVAVPHGALHPRRSVARDWVTPCGHLVTKEHGRRHKKSALPAFGMSDVLMLSSSAAELLAPLLEPYGEYLPVLVESNPASVFHCTYVVDAADIPESEPSYSVSSPGIIIDFDRPSFKPGTIPESCAFRFPEEQPTSTYYTGGLVRQIRDTVDTTGINFITIWTEAEGPVRRLVT